MPSSSNICLHTRQAHRLRRCLSVSSISPVTAVVNVATQITLRGDVGPGDLISWATYATDCSTTTATEDPTDGTDASTTFTFTEAGTHKLCYQRSGQSVAEEQPDISLLVAGNSPCDITRACSHTHSTLQLALRPSLLTAPCSHCLWLVFPTIKLFRLGRTLPGCGES